MARPPDAVVSSEGLNDPLTGFGSRGRLLTDLERALESGAEGALLAVFALGGYGDYRDYFGQLELQTLVVEIADRFERHLAGFGSYYRPREDEFAALVICPSSAAHAAIESAVAALREPGRFVSITGALGMVSIPDEAAEPIAALRTADQRLMGNDPERLPRDRRQRRRHALERTSQETGQVGR